MREAGKIERLESAYRRDGAPARPRRGAGSPPLADCRRERDPILWRDAERGTLRVCPVSGEIDGRICRLLLEERRDVANESVGLGDVTLSFELRSQSDCPIG